jgi:hypothetical protein
VQNYIVTFSHESARSTEAEPVRGTCDEDTTHEIDPFSSYPTDHGWPIAIFHRHPGKDKVSRTYANLSLLD